MFTPLSRTLRGALLALALTALGPVAGATAAPVLRVPAAPSVTATASDLAAGHWKRDACDGNVTVTWEHLGTRTNAESRWSNPVGGAPSTYMNCRIAYSLDVHWDWPKLCSVTEHELGHLNGLGHADEDTDVMSPFYFEASPECQRTPMPGAAPVATKATARATNKRTRQARARQAR